VGVGPQDLVAVTWTRRLSSAVRIETLYATARIAFWLLRNGSNTSPITTTDVGVDPAAAGVLLEVHTRIRLEIEISEAEFHRTLRIRWIATRETGSTGLSRCCVSQQKYRHAEQAGHLSVEHRGPSSREAEA
jgi:hypothetical protein